MSTRDKQVGGDHYLNMGIQPWDVISAWLTTDEYRGYLLGNVIKYVSRAGRKGPPVEDLEKASHYLEELINTYGREV